MVSENDIRLALKKVLVEIDIHEIDNIQIHMNPEDKINYTGRLVSVKYPTIANERVPVGEVHVGVFFRKS